VEEHSRALRSWPQFVQLTVGEHSPPDGRSEAIAWPSRAQTRCPIALTPVRAPRYPAAEANMSVSLRLGLPRNLLYSSPARDRLRHSPR